MSLFDTLAIDWGSVRIGMAFGQSLTGLVLPYNGDLHWGNFWYALKGQIETRQISQIVVGCPTNFALGLTETSNKITDFIQELEYKLHLWQVNFETKRQFPINPIFKKNQFNQRQATNLAIKNNCLNLTETARIHKTERPDHIKITLVNERYSTQKSQKIQWQYSKTSKKTSQIQRKDRAKFQQTFGPTKTDLNHLAAVEILTSFFNNRANPTTSVF